MIDRFCMDWNYGLEPPAMREKYGMYYVRIAQGLKRAGYAVKEKWPETRRTP